jgi:hypothetical protein
MDGEEVLASENKIARWEGRRMFRSEDALSEL